MSKSVKLKKLHVIEFRGLRDIEMEFADRITLICGKNGTSKSTILGIIAQIFSFYKDYTTKEELSKSYLDLMGKPSENFSSRFSSHFRFSKKFDKPGDMKVDLSVYDALENKDKDLQLGIYNSQDRPLPRPILRGNNDRNITAPLIYLSVGRLSPIAERQYTVETEEYIEKKEEWVLSTINKILLQSMTRVTTTAGSIKSIAGHGDNYDHESISVGQDNVGQIVRALLSFKKLKEEYPNYFGGILLIDEADAGLFPAAQIEFLDFLKRFTKDFGVQVIMTTHSPTMIDEIFQQKDKQNYKVNYLTDTYGNITTLDNVDWSIIESDLHVKTRKLSDEISLPKVRVYCEDDEARQFLNALIRERKLTRIIQIMNVSLGSEQLETLIKERVPEFAKESLIVMDADKSDKKYANLICLPGNYPPDQLLFDFLRRKDAADKFWENELGFTRPVFEKLVRTHLSEFVEALNNPENPLEDYLNKVRKGNQGNGRIREMFKKFYKDKDIQKTFQRVAYNPYIAWSKENEEVVEAFKRDFEKKIRKILASAYRVPSSKLGDYFD